MFQKWTRRDDDNLICMIKERVLKENISRILNKDRLDIIERIEELSSVIKDEDYVDLKEMSKQYNIPINELKIIFFL